MDLGLKGKVVIVTGSAQGIGRATAFLFAEEGAKVVVADLNEEGAKKVVEEIKAKKSEAIAFKIDVTKLPEARNMVKTAVDKFGKLDILVNCAAAWRTNFFMNMPEADWDFEIATVYRSVLVCARAALEHMTERKGGKIINIGSDAGRVGEPNQPVYSGAKGGVIAFTKALAKDVARHGILVNCVCPSMTVGERRVEMEKEMERKGETEALKKYRDQMDRIIRMYPLRKLGKPEDIANTVVFLASERANHITGQTVSVNGGYAMP
jgi:2-hydroxycyclohexanecarboxyl-CoA dehydrogenase